MKQTIIKLSVIISWLCLYQGAWALTVTHLRTEAVKNPSGIDVEQPKFSGIIESGANDGQSRRYSATQAGNLYNK
jgi:hypothetical protein